MWLRWLVIGLIVVVPIIIFLVTWFSLAPRNLWFTFIPEGVAKVVVKGGAFVRVLMQWTGYTLDANGNVVPGRAPWHIFGGLRFYGIWPLFNIHIYNFRWSGVNESGEVELHPSEEDRKEGITKETLDYILLKDDVYYAKVLDAEDQKLLPLEVEVFLTIRVINPKKALFDVQNWLETIINRTKPLIRDAMTTNVYLKLIKEVAAIGEIIMEKLKDRELENEFKDRYGVEVRAIEVKRINPPEKFRETTLEPFIAEQDAKGIRIRAKAEKDRIAQVYGAIGQFGELGKLIKACEAAEKSPLAAAMTVQAVPGLPEVLKGVFGKSPEAVAPHEFRTLKRMVQELLTTLKKKDK